MLPWWSHTNTYTHTQPPCHLQLVDGKWKNCTQPFNRTIFSGFEAKYFYFKMKNSKQPCFIHPISSHCSIFISFCFSTVHLTVFPLLMRKLLIMQHSSHNPVICSSHTAMTCSHQKMNSWIQDICRMNLVHYSPVLKKLSI